MKTALIKNLTAWMLGLSVFIGATTGPVQPAAAETLLVGDTVQLVVLAPFYTELSWNNYAGYLGYQPIGARGKVITGPTVDAWTTWVRVDLTLPTTHVIGWVQVSQVAKVTITSVAPSIMTPPSNATVTAPATASFSVSASGTAPLSYQWQKNGVNVTGATSSSYVTPATTTGDSGSTYRVVVSNSAGSQTSGTAILTVNGTAVNVSLAYSGKLRDKVGQGDLALGADGALDGTFMLTLGAGSGSRTVTGLDLRNSIGGVWDTLPGGVGYWALGTATGLDAALLNGTDSRVNVPLAAGGSLTLFTSDYNATEFVTGMNFTLTVTFADGTTATATTTVGTGAPPATVTLSYSGKLRDKVGQGDQAMSPDGALDGTFMLTLGAGSGSRTVTALDLRNSIGGEWDTLPGGVGYWALGTTTGLDAALLNGTGTRVSVPLAAGGSLTLFASDYNLTEFVPGMGFTLTVSFADGSTAKATTTVNAAPVAPTITTQPATTTVTAPSVATFSASANGTSPFSYQWQKNGLNISGATAATYTTPATSMADSGSTFRVVVTNSAGSVTSGAATLTVNVAGDTTPPSIPTGLSATASSCNQVNISWNASTDSGGSGLKVYNLYRNGSMLKQVLAPAASTSDSGLTPGGSYSYTVSAADNAGNQSAQSALASTNTPPCNLPPVANAGPDKTASPGSAVSMNGSASYDPDGTIASYSWNFGDGSTGSGMSVSHSYASSGTYTASLKVTDSYGASASDTVLVAVSGTPPPSLLTVVFPKGGEPEVFASVFTGCPLFAVRGAPNVAWVEFSVDSTKFDQSLQSPVLTSADGTRLFQAWLPDGQFYQFTRTFLTVGAHRFYIKGYDQANKLIAETFQDFLFMEDPTAAVWQIKPITTEATDLSPDVEESKFMGLLNAYRKGLGLAELQPSTALTKAAQGFSDDMAKNNYFPSDHIDKQGRTPAARVAAAGYASTYRAENMYLGFCDAESAFNAWKFSVLHDANMRNPALREIGIGRSLDPLYPYWFRCYWTTDFGG